MFSLNVLVAVLLACRANEKSTEKPNIEQDSAIMPDTGQDSGSEDSAIVDSGIVIEENVGCEADLSLADVQIPTGQFTLGSFIVQLHESSELTVVHQNDISHQVLQSASANWLSMGNRTLNVTEHQGSFSISSIPNWQCDQMTLQGLQYGNDALWIQGLFLGNTCDNIAFTMRLCPVSENRLGFDIQTASSEINWINLQLLSQSDERIMGMGEQFRHDSLNLKGQRIPVIAQEGGVGRGHAIITPAVNLVSNGSGGSENSTYYAAPHYLTDKRHSVFLKNTAYASFDFTQSDIISLEVHANQVSGEALYGTTPLELLSIFTEYAGRMPSPPEWVNNGVILALARDLNSSLAIVDDLQNRGAHIAGVWNQTWSGINETFIGEQVLWNWTQNSISHPDWQSWSQDLALRNVKTLCYLNSMFLDIADHPNNPGRNLFDEGILGDYFVKDHNDEVLSIPVTAFEVALLDLTNESAKNWMKDIIKTEMIANANCSGWMVDFAEALPFDVHLHDGRDAKEYHNQYPVDWMRLNREAIEEAGRLGDILTFNRSGFTQSPQYSLMFWEGDQLTTWDKYDGLKSAIHGLINGGLSGMALNHSDTGGYTSLSRYGLGYSREEELLLRWMEFSAFTALFRSHEGNQPSANAQVYSNDTQKEQLVRMSKVYKALSFYRRILYQEAESLGYPVVRHLWLHYPEDVAVFDYEYQFLLGSEILVAPTIEKCWLGLCNHNQTVYLPDDEWVHLWTGDEFLGSQEVTVYAPIGYPAVFYRRESPIAEELIQSLTQEGIILNQ